MSDDTSNIVKLSYNFYLYEIGKWVKTRSRGYQLFGGLHKRVINQFKHRSFAASGLAFHLYCVHPGIKRLEREPILWQ